MATQNNINVNVNVSDNGTTAKATKEAEKLKNAFDGVAKSAANINTGGTAGSRAIAAAAAAPVKTAISSATPVGSEALMSEREYNKARGAAGVTGASARDFAKQSEGLGGLVRLYATYAANLYAVGAAFRALSSAMDTANMVKGLDQLGASSGMALGSLSKRLVDVTDGAISLREAMESVAKSSAAGMSNKQILEMGKVAKQASQALGIDMSDAISRLTRASTKLEPELVDELGLFTKTGKASEDYAKSVGKTVTELTDFEKRMAYTNALLAEGKQKFGSIELDTNPYNKLLATTKDLSQAGLELVNKVVAPLVNYLAQSPMALVTVLGTLGTILIKQAIPAIGEFKAGLESAAKEASTKAAQRAEDALNARKAMDQKLILMAGAAADAQVAIVDAAEEKARSFREKGINKSSALYTLLSKDLHEITEAELKRAEAAGKALESKGLKEQAEVYKQATTAVRAYQAEEERLKTMKEAQAEQLRKDIDSWTVFGTVQKQALAQQTAATSKAIVSNAAYQGSIVGITHAISAMNAEISAAGLTGFTKVSTQIKGSIAAIAGAAATLGGRLLGLLNWVGLALTAFSVLDGALSKNGKQLQDYSQSVDRVNASGETLSNTLSKISSKPLEQQLNAESLNATATAILEISDATSAVISNLQKADKAASGWDKFIDGFKTVIGTDLRSTFAKSMTDTVLGSLNKLAGTPEAQAAKEQLAAILNIDPTASAETWTVAFARIAQNGKKLGEVDTVMKNLSTSIGIAAAKSKEFDDALKVSGEKFKAILEKFKVKDEVALFGESIIAASQKTALAMASPEQAIQKLYEISIDFNKLKLFAPEDQANILKYADNIASVNKQYADQLGRLKSLKSELAALQSKEKRSQSYDAKGATVLDYDKQTKLEISAKQKALAEQEVRLAKTEQDVRAITSNFPSVAGNQFARGAKMLEASIEAALGKGSYALQTAILNTLGDIPGVSDERYKIAVAQLNSDSALLQVQKELIRATLLNAAETKLASSRQREYTAQSSILETRRAGGEVAPSMRKELQDASKAVEDQEKVVQFYRMDTKQLMSSYKDIKREAAAGNAEMQSQAQELYGYVSAVAGILSKEQEIADKKAEQAFIRELGRIKEKYAEERKLSEDKLAAANAEAKNIDLKEKTGKLTAKEALDLRSAQEITAINATYELKRLSVLEKIDAINAAAAKTPSKELKSKALAEATRLTESLTTQELEKQNALTEQKLKNSKEAYDLDIRKLDLEVQLRNIAKAGIQAEEDAALQKREIASQLAKDTGQYTKTYQANLDYELQIFKINQEAIRQEVNLTETYRTAKEKLEAERRKEYAASGGKETTRTLELTSILDAEAASYDKQVGAIRLIAAAKLDAAAASKKWNDEQIALNDSLDGLRGLDVIFQGMGDALQGLGSKIADTVLAFDALNKQQLANANSLADIEKRKAAIEESGDSVGAPLLKEEADLRKKIQKDELAGYAKTVSAAKAMFKEKTAAAKALGAVEKVLHIQRLAMDVKELFSKLFTDKAETVSKIESEVEQTAATEAGFLARTGTYISEIFAKFTSTMGPWGWAAAAAVVAALFGGSSGSAPPAGFSSDEQQKAQGTGQAYVTGQLVDRAGGVLGDSAAKADSIVSAVDTLSKEVFGSLGSGSSRIVHELNAIKENTGQTVKALLGQIGGFGSNLSAFGTQEGSNGGTGLVGLISSLWGKSSTSITDTGIQVIGALSSLAQKQGTFQQYENVLQESSSWFGLSSSTDYYTNIRALGDRAVQGLSNVFGNVSNVLMESAKVLEGDGSRALQAIQSFPIDLKVSLRGLTGQDAIDAIMGELSVQLNAAAEKAFPYLKDYQKIGEEFYETVARIVKDGETVTTGLAMVGKGITGLATEAKIAAQQTLVDAVGGVDKFTTGIQYYFDNFLSDEERFRVNFTKLTATFRQAGLVLPKTKQGYIDLMNSINAVADPKAFAVVLNNAEAYNSLLSEQATILDKTIGKFKDFAASLKDFREGLLLGASSTLTPLEKYAKAQEDLAGIYSKAMSGDVDAMGKLQSASQTFLDISKGMYASGAQYASDFSSVMDMLDQAQSFSQTKADTATQQLDTLNEQLGVLKNIDTSLSILSGNAPAARGGWRSGITLVGEQGPEFVDFQTPGRVYTADQTAGMFTPVSSGNNQQVLVAELQALRKEVAQLRKEQQEQTGDMINTNYDANQSLAAHIAEAVTQGMVDSAWQSRNAVTLK